MPKEKVNNDFVDTTKKEDTGSVPPSPVTPGMPPMPEPPEPPPKPPEITPFPPDE